MQRRASFKVVLFSRLLVVPGLDQPRSTLQFPEYLICPARILLLSIAADTAAKMGEFVTDVDVHLFSSVDQSLLYWWDTLFFFYALLYARDLWLSATILLSLRNCFVGYVGARPKNCVLWL